MQGKQFDEDLNETERFIIFYYFSPVLGVFLFLLVWVLVPYLSGFISFESGLFFILLILVLVFILL
jgi:hypothetical protein